MLTIFIRGLLITPLQAQSSVTVEPPDLGVANSFGHTVALSDRWWVVADPYASFTPTGGGPVTNLGRVHVFNPRTGSLIRTLLPPTEDQGTAIRFGLSMA